MKKPNKIKYALHYKRWIKDLSALRGWLRVANSKIGQHINAFIRSKIKLDINRINNKRNTNIAKVRQS